ncbi:hypothetical protein ACHAWF_006308 [Thalassiosira exigua]
MTTTTTTSTSTPPWLVGYVWEAAPHSLVAAAATVVVVYLAFELGFFYHYHRHLVPRANRISEGPPAPYRDYPRTEDRAKLLVRILDRLIEHMRYSDTEKKYNNDTKSGHDNNDYGNSKEKGPEDLSCISSYVYGFIESWFEKRRDDGPYERFSEEFDRATLDVGLCPPPPAMMRLLGGRSSGGDENESSSDSLVVLGGGLSEVRSNSDSDRVSGECTGVKHNATKKHDGSKPDDAGRIRKGNMDEFLSWAFFGVRFSAVQLNPSMLAALDNFYAILETKVGLTFEPGTSPDYRPRAFTFEEIKSLYRPYSVYASVALMRAFANCVLYVMGFRHYTCQRGLRYWHRPARRRPMERVADPPFLFFHGIAPGGHAPYLPMLFLGVLRGPLSHWDRDVFFFENRAISYALCFDSLSEDDTVHGVSEAVRQHLDDATGRNLTLCGHSFGSCQLTWMMKSPEIEKRVRSLILLDPVSILLSEPDVIVNFLYTRQQIDDDYARSNSMTGRVIRFLNETKIHLVASSEMFIEHYLRRSFAWYNSEIWLEDIRRDVKVLACLAEHDEIVNTQKIERELAFHNVKLSREGCDAAFVQKIIWRNVGHAHCISNPERWLDVHHAMRKMESRNVNDDSLRKAQ